MKRYGERITVTLPTQTKRELQALAEAKNVSMSELMRRISNMIVMGNR